MIRKVVYVAASAMTSAAASAVLALPDRPAAPAAAAANRATAAVPHCYHPANRVIVAATTEIVDDDYGVAYESAARWVPRSPCRDINVMAPYNAAGPAFGKPACTPLKVIVAGHDSAGWVDTCGSWVVLAKFVREGKPFVIRAALRPVEVTVAA